MYKNGNCIDNHYLLEGFNENKSKDRQSIRYLQKWLNATNSTMLSLHLFGRTIPNISAKNCLFFFCDLLQSKISFVQGRQPIW